MSQKKCPTHAGYFHNGAKLGCALIAISLMEFGDIIMNFWPTKLQASCAG